MQSQNQRWLKQQLQGFWTVKGRTIGKQVASDLTKMVQQLECQSHRNGENFNIFTQDWFINATTHKHKISNFIKKLRLIPRLFNALYNTKLIFNNRLNMYQIRRHKNRKQRWINALWINQIQLELIDNSIWLE